MNCEDNVFEVLLSWTCGLFMFENDVDKFWFNTWV